MANNTRQVRYLTGSPADYANLKINDRIDQWTYYYIMGNDVSIGENNSVTEIAPVTQVVRLYIGETLIAEGGLLKDLESRIIALEGSDSPGGEPSTPSTGGGGHNFYEDDELPASSELGTSYKENDVFIVKTPVTNASGNAIEDQYYRTAYYLGKDANHNLVWKAMNGNYSAKNVYFDKEFTFTASVGTVTVDTNSSSKKDATGQSIEQFFTELFAQDAFPAADNNRNFPTLSISIASDRETNGEVGTSFTYPTATLTVSDVGEYTYGPATGIKFPSGELTLAQGSSISGATNTVTNSSDMVKNSTMTLTATDGTATNAGLYTDSVKTYHFCASGDYTQGAAPLKRLGTALDTHDPTESEPWHYRIPEGTATAATTTSTYATRTGWRKMFAGGTTTKIDECVADEDNNKTVEEVKSDLIRGLSYNDKATASTATPSDTNGITFSVGQVNQVIFAYPADLTTKTPTFYYKPGAWGTCPDSMKFISQTVQVADQRKGVNGLKTYTVYTYTPEQALVAKETLFGVKFV